MKKLCIAIALALCLLSIFYAQSLRTLERTTNLSLNCNCEYIPDRNDDRRYREKTDTDRESSGGNWICSCRENISNNRREDLFR